ncbi:MAG TPA: hypothetical protein VNG12_19565 [Acidimicrobiales bacterium]|nr:hypothetical protein [Acidimicrobiales bacterium]
MTTEFLRLESHLLFAHHFCRVGRGNEKGQVDAHVSYQLVQLLARLGRARRRNRMPDAKVRLAGIVGGPIAGKGQRWFCS